MNSWKPAFYWGIISGQPIDTNYGIVTPKSRILKVKFPYGGIVWNQPVALELERDGDVQTLKIDNITRKSVLLMAAVLVIFWSGTLIITLAPRLKNRG